MMFKDKYIHKFYAFALAALFALTLAGCGGGGGGSAAAPDPEPTPMPTAYEQAVAAIAAAETEEAARAAVATAVAAGISGAQLQSLNMAVDERVMALAAMAAAEHRRMLVAAAMCEAATQECVDAHDALIEALEDDIAKLAEDDDATNAQEAAAQKALEDAQEAREEVAMALAGVEYDTDTGMKVRAAEMAANGLEDERSAEDIAAAEEAIMAAKEAIAEGDDPDAFMAQIEAAEMAVARAKARNAVDMAVMAAQNASAMLTDDQSKATVEAARAAVTAAKQAVMDNADALTDADETGFNAQIALAEAPVGPLESKIAAEEDAEAKRQQMAMEEAAEEEREAMEATAKQLFEDITKPVEGTFDPATGSVGDAERMAGWDASGNIAVGDGSASGTVYVTLYEDKDAPAAKLHGWQRQRFAVAHDNANNTTDSSFEAVVYSDIGDPTPGRKFGTADAGTDDDREYEYSWTAVAAGVEEGELQITGDTAVATRIVSSMFDQGAGVKEFELPTNTVRYSISGSYQGVAGTYYCTPAASSTCAVQKVANGFTLGGTADADNAFTAGGGTWTFKPTDPNARVMSSPDDTYASYGWWLRKHKDEADNWQASAFARPRGTPGTGAFNGSLVGSATYVGGAAGKYAISSPTGGTNEGGHFTATATLTANFGDVGGFNADRLTGTIDDFKVGDDGEARDWSVALMKGPASEASNLTTAGLVSAAGDDRTQWTIGGEAEAKSGEWTAQMYETGADGVPGVVTGTFYTEYGNTGRMVGAFGADKQ